MVDIPQMIIYHAEQTNDGGYIAVGKKFSYTYGSFMGWLLKLNESGEKEWEHIWGGAKFDEANEIKQTSDGGYVTLFYYESFGFGDDDDWLYRLNKNGEKEWQRTLGGLHKDFLSQIIETIDGYIIVGYTESYGNGSDAWLIKINEQEHDGEHRIHGNLFKFLDAIPSFIKIFLYYVFHILLY